MLKERLKHNISKSSVFFYFFTILMNLLLLLIPVDDLDELWVFSVIRELCRGGVLYKDTNTITTPFYYIFMSLFLWLKPTLMFFRFLNCIMLVILFILIYRKIDKVSSDKIFRVCVLGLFMCLSVNYRFLYNTLILFLTFLLHYIHNCSSLSYRQKSFLCGFMGFLCILTKQTFGVFLYLAEVLIQLRLMVLDCKTFKERANLFTLFLLGSFIPGSLFLVYLLLTDSFKEFFDYCFFGLFSFSSNSGCRVDGCFLLMLIFAVSFIVDIVKASKFHHKFFFSFEEVCQQIALILGVGPIIDSAHLFSVFIYFLYVYLGTDLQTESRTDKLTLNHILIAVILPLFLLNEGMVYVDYLKSSTYFEGSACYSKSPVPPVIYDFVVNVDKERSGIEKQYCKKVLYLGGHVAYLDLYTGDYNGVYSLFLTGNLGAKTAIEHIQALEDGNVILGLPSDYLNDNWQNPLEIEPYLEQNWVNISSEITYVYDNKFYNYYLYRTD